MNKIFNISLQRTGTQSVHDFLSKANIRSMHFIGHYGVDQYYNFIDKSDLVSKISFLENKFDAFNDMPYNTLYTHFLQKYPGSKFIFLTRDFDSWYRSIQNFNVFYNKQKALSGVKGLTSFEKICYSEYIDYSLDNIYELSEKHYYEHYNGHYETVFSTFKNYENFFQCDLNDVNLSKKLSEFLELSVDHKIKNVDFFKKCLKEMD